MHMISLMIEFALFHSYFLDSEPKVEEEVDGEPGAHQQEPEKSEL